MRIDQPTFQGEIPLLARQNLPDGKAALALNTKLYSGNVLPFKGMVKDADVNSGTETIFQYRDGGNTYWFEWSTDVDIAESPIADDANNRIYMSGTVKGLRWTDNDLSGIVTPALHYPIADNTLVFSPPGDTPVVSISGVEPADPDPFSAETRQYVYTWVTIDGWESSPSPISAIVDPIYPGQEVTIDIESNPGTVDLNITKVRIYRTTPAGTTQLVEELDKDITGISYPDTILTENLQDVLVTTGWAPASNALKGLMVLDQGAFCAFQNNELWFSEPYIPYAYPLKYRLSVMFDIVAIKAATQNIYIATEGRPYVAFGTNPGEYQLVKIDEDLPCVSKNSMIDAGERAYYASTDGIVMFEGTTAKLVTTNLIEADDWEANYDPTNIKAIWFDNKMFCFTPSTAFIFNPDAGDIVHLGVTVSAVYNSLEENTLYILIGTEIFKWDNDGASFMTYEYQGKDTISSPTVFSCAQVNAESYNSLIFDLYRDKVKVHSHTVLNNDPFRLPTKRGRVYSYGLRGQDEVRGVFIASTMSELTNV